MGAVCPQTSNRMAEKTIPQSKTPRAHRTALDRLDYKISRYEEAAKTGKLSWD